MGHPARPADDDATIGKMVFKPIHFRLGEVQEHHVGVCFSTVGVSLVDGLRQTRGP